MAAVAYHVAPSAVRRSIAKHGLLPGSYGHVWLHTDEQKARLYQRSKAGTVRGADGADLWRAVIDGLSVEPYEGMAGVVVSLAAIPPDRLQMIHTTPGAPTEATARLLANGVRWQHHVHNGRIEHFETQ